MRVYYNFRSTWETVYIHGSFPKRFGCAKWMAFQGDLNEILVMQFPIQFQSMIKEISFVLLPADECHWILPVISQTYLPLDQMTAISHTPCSNAFSWKKSFVFWSQFHWSLFLNVQLTIIQQWFRWWLGAEEATSHYLNQRRPSSPTHICGTQGRRVNTWFRRRLDAVRQQAITWPDGDPDLSRHMASLYHIELIPWMGQYIQGLYSLSVKTSYHEISRSLEAARFGFRLFQSLWHLAGISAAALPRRLPNFRAIRSL